MAYTPSNPWWDYWVLRYRATAKCSTKKFDHKFSKGHSFSMCKNSSIYEDFFLLWKHYHNNSFTQLYFFYINFYISFYINFYQIIYSNDFWLYTCLKCGFWGLTIWNRSHLMPWGFYFIHPVQTSTWQKSMSRNFLKNEVSCFLLESSNMKDDWECKYSKLFYSVNYSYPALLYPRLYSPNSWKVYTLTKLFPFSPASSLWLLLFNSLFEWVLLFCFLTPYIYDTIQQYLCLLGSFHLA